MSNLLFPSTLPGLQINVEREPDYDVKVQTTQSRKELRWTPETYPITKFKVSFEVLRSDSSLSNRARELQQALGHIARHYGMLDSFLLTDPADSSVTDHGFAVGDGTTATFQLQRTLAGDIIDAAGFEYRAQTKPYTNLFKNSFFATDSNADGLADSWSIYNNESATVIAYASIVPGPNGGKAQRISWGTNAGSTKGINSGGTSSPAWVAGRWYTVGIKARAFGSNVGKFLDLRFNTPSPNQNLRIANPALSGAWQLYVFQLFWNLGTAPLSESFVTINDSATTASGPTNCFGDLDFAELIAVAGQYDATTLPQPFSTPAAAIGTATPAYWPSYADGYEPIFDLNGDSTFYEDGTWRGRRTLYPYARTNLLGFSEAFDNAAWVKTNATITANTTTAPDGTSNADTFSEGAAVTVQHFVEETVTAETAGELRCYSIFVKANNLPNVTLLTNAANTFLNFNLSTGVIFSQGTEIVASGVVTDPRWPGWYRVWWVHRATSLASTFRVLAQADGTYSGAAYTGTSRTFFKCGAMVERTSNLNGPTPYIQTPSSAAVTVIDYTLGSTGIFTPVSVPAAGTFFSFDGSYFRRVRSAQQSLPVEQLVQSMWAAKSWQLVSVKP